MGRSQEEEAFSRRAVAAHPDDLKARLYLANSLTEQNKLDDAAKEWHQALVIDPNNYIAHYNLGVILERQQLPQQAIKELRLSLALQPNQPSAHTIIGRLYTTCIRSLKQQRSLLRPYNSTPQAPPRIMIWARPSCN